LIKQSKRRAGVSYGSTNPDRFPRYFPRDALRLKRAGRDARYWSVSLSQAQLTYFELEPNCRFETHQHASEQITLVLEGELYFETSSGVDRIGAGEVIAIPSNVPHAAFTKELTAKAVDAWSPVNKTYAGGRTMCGYHLLKR
jgi:quercetin dioxygenase-like cupin family protein